MAGRVLELALQIKGKLESSYPESLRKALQQAKTLEGKYGDLANKMRQTQKISNTGGGNKYLQEQMALTDRLGGLKTLQEQSEQYKTLMRSQTSNNQQFTEAKAKVKELGTQYQQAQQTISQLKAKQQELKVSFEQSQRTTDQLKTKLAGLKAIKAEMEKSGKSKQDEAYKSLQNQIKQISQALQQAKAATKSAQNEFKTLSSGVRQAESELQRLGNAFNKAKADAKGLGTSMTSQLSTMRQLQSSLSAAGYSTQNFGASQMRLQTQIAQATTEMQRQAQAQARLQQVRQNQSQAQFDFNNASNNFSGTVAMAQSVMTPFSGAIEKAMDFEHAMSKVKALTQGENIRNGNLEQVRTDMARLTAQAKELGATTQFTMTQSAEAMSFLGMAGWKTTQITNAMPGMLNLAAASGSDLARTADVISDNMTAMGLTAGQMVRAGKNLDRQVEASAHFMDVYAYAMSNSNVNLESLGETMKYAAPVAAAYGASLEDTAAMTMIMGNAGIKGSMAGTALRMGLLRLSGPPKKASKEMEALGISMSDATAQAMEAQAAMKAYGIEIDENASPADKMNQVLTQLSTKMAGLGREEKLAAVGAIFGANAASGWVNILEAGPEAFQKYRDALRDCDGYAKQMADTMNDDARGAMIALGSAVDAVQINFGQAFLGSLRNVVESGITPLLSSMAQWIQQNPQIAAAIGGTVAAFVALAVAVAGFGAISAGITAAIATISTAMTALSSQTILSGTIFSGFRAKMAANYAMLNGLSLAGMRASFIAAMTSMKVSMLGVVASANAMRLRVVTAITSMSVTSALSSAGTAIRSFGAAMLAAGGSALSLTISMLPIIAIAAAIAVAAYLIYSNWSTVAPFFQMLWNTISGAFQQAWTTIQPAIDKVKESFSILTNSIGGSQSIISVLIGAFATLLTGIAGILATVITTAANFVSMLISIFGGITTFITGVLAGDWSTAWKGLCDAGTALVEGFVNTVKSLFGGIGDTIGNVIDMVKGVFGGDVKAVVEHENARTAWQNGQAGDQAMLKTAQVTSQAPPAETSQAVMQVQQLGDASQQAASAVQQNGQNTETINQSMSTVGEGMQQLTANVPAVGEAFQQVQTAMQPTGESMTQLNTNIQTLNPALTQQGATLTTNNAELTNNTTQLTAANSALQQLQQILTMASTALSTFNNALTSTNSSLQALSSGSSSAATAIQNLATAAQSAVSAIQSAASSAASAAVSAGAKPATNFRGGIYPKGEFLTTFAEKSPEAAIPIDNSRRAIELWQQTGAMLGVYPGEVSTAMSAPPNLKEQFSTVTNIQNQSPLPSMATDSLNNYQSTIRNFDYGSDSLVRVDKIAEQRELLQTQLEKLAITQSISSTDISIAQNQPITPAEAIVMSNSTENDDFDTASPVAAAPSISEGASITIEYNPTINITGNVNDNSLEQLKALLDEQRRNLKNDVDRILKERDIQARRVSFSA